MENTRHTLVAMKATINTRALKCLPVSFFATNLCPDSFISHQLCFFLKKLYRTLPLLILIILVAEVYFTKAQSRQPYRLLTTISDSEIVIPAHEIGLNVTDRSRQPVCITFFPIFPKYKRGSSDEVITIITWCEFLSA